MNLQNLDWVSSYRSTRDRLRRAREYLVLVQAQQSDQATDQQRSDFEWFQSQLQDPQVQRELRARWPHLAATVKKTGP
jgi:hypothetical protein